MASSDWEEIKRLAADLQRAQLATSLQKLSETNCVEIINKLIEKKLLEVYFTSSGKEYITPAQLSKEIKDELYVSRGRISLTDLSAKLEISLNLIQKKSLELANSDSRIYLVIGQLISEDYLDTIAEEINEKLQQSGLLSISTIAIHYDLPGEFLLTMICKRLNKAIKGQQDENDPQTIFTESFISRHKYQIRGVLTAITQPTSVSNIISRFNLQERLFFKIAEKFIASDEVSGTISGARMASQAVYIPSIYSKAQFQWVHSFLKQNGYLDYESLENRGISEPEAYIKRNFQEETITYVPGACVSQLFIDQIDANLDDALVNDGFVDIYPFLPSAFSGEFCSNLINLVLKMREEAAKSSCCSKPANCKIFCDSIVVSENLLTKISISLENLMPLKAREAIAKGAFKHQLSNTKSKFDDDSSKNKKEERRKKAAGGKAGGGTQGRETKTKSTKNKAKSRKVAKDSDEEESNVTTGRSNIVEFLSLEELQEEISKDPGLEDCPEELLEEIATYLHEPLTEKFQEVAKATFLDSLSGGGDMRKKNHQQLQEKIGALLITIRLAEKGAKEFGEDTHAQLCKYLLRTHCTEIVNDLVLYLAKDSQINLKGDKELSPELRLKIINQLDNDMKAPLLTVHKTLTGASVDQFLNEVDDALAVADIMFKKKDNKKDRQVLLNHRSGLVDQLNASLNSALSLHLSCLIIFQVITGNILHASGKFVPQILMYLKPHLTADFYGILQEYQNLVMRSLTTKEDQSSVSIINSRLEELTPKLKELTISFKKGNVSRENSLSET